MRTLPLFCLTAVLAACAAPTRSENADPEPAPEAAVPAEQSGSAAARDAWPWPVAVSHFGRSRMRMRAVPDATAICERGPAVTLEANLVTDDPGLLLAGGPRASVTRPSRDVVGGEATPFLEDDLWSGDVSAGGQTAYVLVPVDPTDQRAVDIEVRCRLMRVHNWRTYQLEGLHVGEERDLDAPPYELSVHCLANEVIVTAPTPGASRGRLPDREGVTLLLGASWAARAAEVRDARGRLLDPSGEAANQRAWTIGYELRGDESTRRGAPIEYPVTVRLAVPETYDVEYPIFEWRGITLPPLRGAAATQPARDFLAELPRGYREGDTESRRRLCREALAAAPQDASAWKRIADLLLVCTDYSLREVLSADAASGDETAPELLRALDAWMGHDEATFDRLLAEARESGDGHRLVVGMMSNINDVDLARTVDTIADVDPLQALPWLRLERTLCECAIDGGSESRLSRDDLLRSLDRAIDAALMHKPPAGPTRLGR